MKHSVNTITVNLLTLSVLAVIQVRYLFIPAEAVVSYNRLTPVFYVAILIVYIIFTGREKILAPIGDKTANSATYAALFILLLYVAVVFLSSVLVGVQTNRDASNSSVIVNHFWIFAVPAIIAEVLRFKIIRSTYSYRVSITVVLILVYTFTQLSAYYGVIDTDRVIRSFFVWFIPAIIMNSVLTYMAFQSPLRALLIVRCLFLFPYLSPAIPNTNSAVWAAVTCSVLFLSVIIYYFNMRTPEGGFQRVARNRLRKPSRSSLALLCGILIVIVAFFLRAFVYFPTVVLTGSMSGDIERGSVAVVQKVAEEDVVETVKLEDVILFRCDDKNTEVMHRVIEIIENNDGETFYITKGDANPRADTNPAEVEQIVGIINSYIPHIGWPIVIIRSLL